MEGPPSKQQAQSGQPPSKKRRNNGGSSEWNNDADNEGGTSDGELSSSGVPFAFVPDEARNKTQGANQEVQGLSSKKRFLPVPMTSPSFMVSHRDSETAARPPLTTSKPSVTGPPPVAYRVDGKRKVDKNSLTEEALIEAKLRVKCVNKTKTLTEAEKREERRAANRLSAFQSRQRRKTVIEELQKQVSVLSKSNATQREEMQKVLHQFKLIQRQNQELKAKLEAMTSSGNGSSSEGTSASNGTNSSSLYHTVSTAPPSIVSAPAPSSAPAPNHLQQQQNVVGDDASNMNNVLVGLLLAQLQQGNSCNTGPSEEPQQSQQYQQQQPQIPMALLQALQQQQQPFSFPTSNGYNQGNPPFL